MRPPQANRQIVRPKDNAKQIQRMKKSDLQRPPHKQPTAKPKP